jgi:hypothetical protein
MPAFFVIFLKAILRLCDLSVPALGSVKPPKNKPRIKTRTPAPSRTRRLHFSRVTGPRQALRLIADMVGQVSAIPREPDPKDLELAWMILGDPVADFIRALIGLGESVPMFRRRADEEAEMDKLFIKACRSPRILIKAIWLGVPLKAPRQAEAMMARRVDRLFGGVIPEPEVTENDGAEPEWHVVDQYNRPLICRVRERADGRLEILDRGGGWLDPQTTTVRIKARPFLSCCQIPSIRTSEAKQRK